MTRASTIPLDLVPEIQYNVDIWLCMLACHESLRALSSLFAFPSHKTKYDANNATNSLAVVSVKITFVSQLLRDF
jgi:hypothetical protein